MLTKSLETLLNNLAELIKVKTIMTLMMVAALTYGFITGLVPVELYAAYAGSIITYYFTRKEDKN